MSTHNLPQTQAPIVRTDGGKAQTNSLDVSAFFNKEHKNVLRAIDALVAEAPELGRLNFEPGCYTLPTTGEQQHRYFNMDRTGFVLLAMGHAAP